MQSRITSRLAKKLRHSHAQTKSWRATAEELDIRTADGNPDPGLAYRIAERGYEPARLETRARLGLGRKVTRGKAKPLHEWSPARLLWALENRETMP